MTNFAHVECPSCGWESLADPNELSRLRGCRLCGGPFEVRVSPLPWHQPHVVARR